MPYHFLIYIPHTCNQSNPYLTPLNRQPMYANPFSISLPPQKSFGSTTPPVFALPPMIPAMLGPLISVGYADGELARLNSLSGNGNIPLDPPINGEGGGDSALCPRRRRRKTRRRVKSEAASRIRKMDIPTERAIMRVVWAAEGRDMDCDSERGKAEETAEIVEIGDAGCVIELVCRRVVWACDGACDGAVVCVWEEVEGDDVWESEGVAGE